MTPLIAFLRGINVGGHRVKMERLRELFEELGFTDVSTFIASGNVHFTPDRTDAGEDELTARIERHLDEALGYSVDVFLRTTEELRAIAVATESAPPHTALYVVFLKVPLSEAGRDAVHALRSEVDDFHFGERESFWILQCKLSESPLFGPGIDRALMGVTMTSRNVNTVNRILGKVGA